MTLARMAYYFAHLLHAAWANEEELCPSSAVLKRGVVRMVPGWVRKRLGIADPKLEPTALEGRHCHCSHPSRRSGEMYRSHGSSFSDDSILTESSSQACTICPNHEKVAHKLREDEKYLSAWFDSLNERERMVSEREIALEELVRETFTRHCECQWVTVSKEEAVAEIGDENAEEAKNKDNPALPVKCTVLQDEGIRIAGPAAPESSSTGNGKHHDTSSGSEDSQPEVKVDGPERRKKEKNKGSKKGDKKYVAYKKPTVADEKDEAQERPEMPPTHQQEDISARGKEEKDLRKETEKH